MDVDPSPSAAGYDGLHAPKLMETTNFHDDFLSSSLRCSLMPRDRIQRAKTLLDLSMDFSKWSNTLERISSVLHLQKKTGVTRPPIAVQLGA
jgi:hypothetical protein